MDSSTNDEESSMSPETKTAAIGAESGNEHRQARPITGEEIAQIRMISGRSIHSPATPPPPVTPPAPAIGLWRPGGNAMAKSSGSSLYDDSASSPVKSTVTATTAATMLTKSTTRIAKTSRLKFLVLGAPNVGKTLILRRMQNMNWTLIYDTSKYTPTIGPDLHRLKCGTIEAIDIGGQERLMAIARKYCELFQVFVVVFDLTDAESFLMARYWLDFITAQRSDLATGTGTGTGAGPSTPGSSIIEAKAILLIGNKNDLTEQRQVGARLAKTLAMTYRAEYLEISAKLDLTMDQVLETLEMANGIPSSTSSDVQRS